ncbi:MAG: hypothetical protein Q8K67_14565 [Geothrix sp.]|nr:hypothetical protein [Geothrix sp.]
MKEFAHQTGQGWKYSLWVVLTWLAIILTFAFSSLWSGNPLKLPEAITTGTYFIIAIFWLLWWAAAIRCPECKKSYAWYYMNKGSHSDLLARQEASPSCPSCGYSPTHPTHQYTEIP